MTETDKYLFHDIQSEDVYFKSIALCRR